MLSGAGSVQEALTDRPAKTVESSGRAESSAALSLSPLARWAGSSAEEHLPASTGDGEAARLSDVRAFVDRNLETLECTVHIYSKRLVPILAGYAS